MAGAVMAVPRLQFFGNDGAPLDGGLLYTYVAGSPSTPLDTYSDYGLSVVNPNPIELNSAGRPEVSGTEISIYPAVANYKYVLTTSAGVEVWSADNIFTPSMLHFATDPATNSIPYVTGATTFGVSAKLTFDGTTLTVNAPIDTSGATGGQITFPATQNPSSDAHTLDDYAENTWTPVIAAASGSGTQSTQTGSYVKVGKLVYLSCTVSLSNVGTLSGSVKITGLPFTSGGSSTSAIYFTNLTSNWIALTGLITSGGTSIFVYGRQTAGTGLVALAASDLANTTELRIGISYVASA